MATDKSASYAWVWIVIIVVIAAAVYMYVQRDDSDQMIEDLADRTRPVEAVVEVPSVPGSGAQQREQDLASRVLNALREQQAATAPDSVPTLRLADPPAPPPPAALTQRPVAATDDHVPTLSLTPVPVSDRPSLVGGSAPVTRPAPALSSVPPLIVEPHVPGAVTAPPARLPPVPPVVAVPPVRTASPALTSRPAARPGTYTIKPGDHYSLIAESVFGDEKYWMAIQDANPGVDPTRLQIGQVIKLPDLGTYRKQKETEAVQVRTAATQGGSGLRSVTVESGDVLSTISQKVYGKSSLWRLIYDANRDQLVSPDDLQPGMKLKIPPLPAGATSQR